MPRKPRPKPTPVDREELERRLQAEFCPPLDSSLVTALLLDFPTPTTADEHTLRRSLRTLASSSGEPSSTDPSTDPSTDLTSTDPSTIASSLEVWSLDESEERDAGGGSGHDDPITFILSVFPSWDHVEVTRRLASAGEDVERVLEELLSDEFIERERDREDDEFDFRKFAFEDDHAEPSKSKREKRRVKALAKATTTLSLTSTSPLPRPTPVASSSTTASSESALSQARPSTNEWVSLSSLSSHLGTLLSLPVLQISSFFHASPALPTSPSPTLLALVSRTALSRPPVPATEIDAFFDALGLEWEQRWERDRAATALRACEGRAGDAIDLLEVIASTADNVAGGRVAPIVLGPPAPRPFPLPPPPPPTGKARLVQSDAQDTSAEECAQLAEEYLGKRNAAFRSAARHFQKGSRGDRGAAWYWAEEGREMGRLAKVWEGRGMRALVGQRRAAEPNTVDLHGVTLHHALELVRDSCNSWYSSPLPRAPLRIVTGIGRHSKGQNPVLLPAVVKMLDREGWRWDWDDRGQRVHGAVIVTGIVAR